MAIPFLGSLTKSMGEPAIKLGVGAAVGAWEYHGWRGEVSRGENPYKSAASRVFNFAMMNSLSMPAQIALQGAGLAFGVGQAAYRGVLDYNRSMRLARTPFSQRFEHSQASYSAQSNGLQQIAGAWQFANMGSEAGAFHSRYGR